ncbi:oxidoreductase domain protein [Rippkaea orientalis PCC 8801]|uniref:Oxidoreductase domain protein n=1 Tax=Rippkaea orientalis (strain PCC 8801 / RF-1) TaxID=41431 RepID=B7JUP1_RIPO1|nr:Gfo/Idh/MocA family oxidoreductase [Rippkaea orientalis]ACK65585.1 oxidoreductase domain protein [Rippkaea orientalis PCC 8801]
MKTRLAILGVGRWGTHLVRNFLQHPQAELVAIADPNLNNLQTCQAKFGLNESNIIFTSDWETIKQKIPLDAVIIATPATTHYSLIKDSLASGCHVLAEKPLTLDTSECLELTRLAEQRNVQLMVDHTYLFHPAVNQGKTVINSGKLGEMRYGYASRTHLGPVRQDVDALWDLAIHDIAIFNHWLGQFPSQVQARGQVWLQSDRTTDHSPTGLADLVWVRLIYPDGFEAMIHLCWFNPDKQRRLCVVGSQGTLIFDEMNPNSPLTLQKGYLEPQGEGFVPQGQENEVIELEKAEPLKQVCDRFLETIKTGVPCAVSSGWVGTQLVKILTALSLSMQHNGTIINL